MSICRQSLRLEYICSLLILVTGCAEKTQLAATQKDLNNQSQLLSDEPNSTESAQIEKPSNKSLFLEKAKVDFSNWPNIVFEDSKDTFSASDNLTALLLAGAASVVMNQDADNEIAEHFEKHGHLHNLRDESMNVIGHPGTHFAAAGLWYVISAENQDELNNQRALIMLRALSVSWVTTMGLKAIRNNETPNGKNWAWPSGHTSSSFTVASVLDELYGHNIGIPAYAAASFAAYRMMDTGDHWASDVVFGATLGWIVGHSVGGKHKTLDLAGYKISPHIVTDSGPAMGISLQKKF